MCFWFEVSLKNLSDGKRRFHGASCFPRPLRWHGDRKLSKSGDPANHISHISNTQNLHLWRSLNIMNLLKILILRRRNSMFWHGRNSEHQVCLYQLKKKGQTFGTTPYMYMCCKCSQLNARLCTDAQPVLQLSDHRYARRGTRAYFCAAAVVRRAVGACYCVTLAAGRLSHWLATCVYFNMPWPGDFNMPWPVDLNTVLISHSALIIQCRVSASRPSTSDYLDQGLCSTLNMFRAGSTPGCVEQRLPTSRAGSTLDMAWCPSTEHMGSPSKRIRIFIWIFIIIMF